MGTSVSDTVTMGLRRIKLPAYVRITTNAVSIAISTIVFVDMALLLLAFMKTSLLSPAYAVQRIKIYMYSVWSNIQSNIQLFLL